MSHIERAAARYSRWGPEKAGGELGGLAAVARCLAPRLGLDEPSAIRLIQRVMNAHRAGRPITQALADRLAIALDLHPVLIWPDEWMAS